MPHTPLRVGNWSLAAIISLFVYRTPIYILALII
jgi:hypothetical protein